MLFAVVTESGKGIHGSAVYGRDASHTDDQAAGSVLYADLFDGICGAKE